MNKRFEVQSQPTQKTEWCLDLMIKRIIIKSERHRLKLFQKKKTKTKKKKRGLLSIKGIRRHGWFEKFFGMLSYITSIFDLPVSGRDGNGAGWGRRMGSSSPPRMVVALPRPRPAPGCGENYLAPSSPLGALQGLAPPLIQFYIYK